MRDLESREEVARANGAVELHRLHLGHIPIDDDDAHFGPDVLSDGRVNLQRSTESSVVRDNPNFAPRVRLDRVGVRQSGNGMGGGCHRDYVVEFQSRDAAPLIRVSIN
jgi:hypothetical protein